MHFSDPEPEVSKLQIEDIDFIPEDTIEKEEIEEPDEGTV